MGCGKRKPGRGRGLVWGIAGVQRGFLLPLREKVAAVRLTDEVFR